MICALCQHDPMSKSNNKRDQNAHRQHIRTEYHDIYQTAQRCSEEFLKNKGHECPICGSDKFENAGRRQKYAHVESHSLRFQKGV
ncbi:hypothetical protein TWF694_009923 [Orbilia ellipsospora]|uniref:Uncharacterized protein n=1 Tax=Orbilia ellipsospora TaxID=2528407 RepID=A0AAV9XFG1_9PEZI